MFRFRFILLATCLIFLVGCQHLPDYLKLTVQQPNIPQPQAYFADFKAPIEKYDFLEVTPEMQQFLHDLQLDDMQESDKIITIYDAIFKNKGFNIDYDMFTTASAGETFASKTGNCVSLTAMFVALGRHVGLKAKFQEANTAPIWHSENGIFTELHHINTLMYRNRNISVIIDLYDRYAYRPRDGRVISDAESYAFYYNNKAAEAMMAHDNANAYYYYQKALSYTPELAYMWSNFGTLFTRIKEYELAEQVYRYALNLNPREYNALLNLRSLYYQTDRFELAENLNNIIDAEYGDNPHYLKSVAERALMSGDMEKAVDYIKRVEQIKPGLIDPNSIILTNNQNQRIEYQIDISKY
ncbi:tetratricopeptide repeat protein [Catenovulum sp. SX2]|uniref:tetratricopeptide repeat protein n=1 Tax=Catenovulum sp. SX2 TaxID=3398614 RepID=UPI003F837FAC